MNPLVESIAVTALGIAITSTQAQADKFADDVADKIIGVVNDTETQCDDVAARRVAELMERIAVRVRAAV